MSNKGSNVNNTTTFTHSDNGISINYSGGGVSESMQIIYDRTGLVESVSGSFSGIDYSQEFTYSGSELKSSINTFAGETYTKEYTWANGNISAVDYGDETVRFNYSDNSNRAKLDIGALVSWEFSEFIGEYICVPIKFNGMYSNKLITGSNSTILSLQYDFDSKGYPTAVHVYDGNLHLETLKITYYE